MTSLDRINCFISTFNFLPNKIQYLLKEDNKIQILSKIEYTKSSTPKNKNKNKNHQMCKGSEKFNLQLEKRLIEADLKWQKVLE